MFPLSRLMNLNAKVEWKIFAIKKSFESGFNIFNPVNQWNAVAKQGQWQDLAYNLM